MARRGYAFAQVRPVGQRDPATRTVSIGYIVEEGPRVYIERINVRGNTRTRDYVVRRELDLGEGDAYNKVLIDRAERRLNNLGYFKKVRVTNEPGSAPDRVVVNIDVEDQSTGSFSISGGYSTAEGFIGEVSVSESNFLGRGHFVRVAGQLGEKSQGIDFSFTEPYFLGYRLAAGIDLFSKFADQSETGRYESRTTGGQIRFGLPITEEFGVTLRYSLYQTEIAIPNDITEPFNDCTVPIRGLTPLNPDGTPNANVTNLFSCINNGEASVAIKEAEGSTITSLAGLTLAYSTLDSGRDPRNGFYAEVQAGRGRPRRRLRSSSASPATLATTTRSSRTWSASRGCRAATSRRSTATCASPTSSSSARAWCAASPRPASARATCRSPTTAPTPSAARPTIGGSLEVQFPFYGLPRELGLSGAVFADAGTLFGYDASRGFDINGNGRLDCDNPNVQPECVNVRDKNVIRSSVGASVLWQSPLGPIRFDYAVALSKDDGVLDPKTGAAHRWRPHPEPSASRAARASRDGRISRGVGGLIVTGWSRHQLLPARAAAHPGRGRRPWRRRTRPEGADLTAVRPRAVARSTAPARTISPTWTTPATPRRSRPRGPAPASCRAASPIACRRAPSPLVTPRPTMRSPRVLARLYPTALRPGSLFGATGVSPGSIVHPTARLERGAVVDPGAVIGPGAEIGAGTVIAAAGRHRPGRPDRARLLRSARTSP